MITGTISTTGKDLIYHIYPLGMLDAEQKNPSDGHIRNRLPELMNWAAYLKDLGVTCIYLGPVFASESHGYDTVDYFRVDERLGTNADLKALVEYYHQHEIRIILDAVFNHVGRGFAAFRDVLGRREASSYKSWFTGLDFSGNNPLHDGLDYETWDGHYSLVKLDLTAQEVKNYLFSVIDFWIDEFKIDGIRLDAADVMDRSFLVHLSAHAKFRKDDFWLVGEVIHGDYRLWTDEGGLDSVTNYEAYKGLYSSFNDSNFYELGWTLNRQFGADGMYKNIPLYNFCDNHDVNRIRSQLDNPAHIFPLYIALFTIPGIPVLYYGSENGLSGERDIYSDNQLRPAYSISQAQKDNDLRRVITRLARIRKETPALNSGTYSQLSIAHKQIAWTMETNQPGPDHQKIVVALNSSGKEAEIPVPDLRGDFWDILDNEHCSFDGKIKMPPNWGRILLIRE